MIRHSGNDVSSALVLFKRLQWNTNEKLNQQVERNVCSNQIPQETWRHSIQPMHPHGWLPTSCIILEGTTVGASCAKHMRLRLQPDRAQHRARRTP